MFHTHANLVLLDVVVRDKGQPVEGLQASNFHVLEDGHAQKVTVFEEHKATDAVESSKPLQLPPNTFSNNPQYTVTSAANVLLLDALNTPMDDQKFVRAQMLKYLHNIPAGTQIAVFTLASQLRMVSGFRTDARAIEAALTPAHAPAQQSPLVHPGDDTAESQVEALMVGQQATVADSMSMLASVRAFEQDRQAFRAADQSALTIAALDALGRYLSPIPGRKNLIWFSGAFPISFAEDLQPGEGLPYEDFSKPLHAMEARLARARVAVYPVDARGMMTLRNANVANIVPKPEVGIGADTQAAQQDGEDDDIRMPQQWNDEHTTMQHVAEATGGEAFVNTNDVGRALEKAIADGSNYYTLGYAPPDTKEDGAYHAIAVRLEDVKSEGKYQLAYRRGYYSTDPNQPGSPAKMGPMTTALEYGAPPLSQVIFEVRPLPAGDPELHGLQPAAGPAGKPPEPLRTPVRRFVIDYSIDPHQIVWNHLPDGMERSELEVAQELYSAEGKRVNSTDAGLEVTLTPAQMAQDMRGGLRVRQEIDVPGEDVSVRMAVRDVTSGRIGTVEIPLSAETRQVAAKR
ncbi:MAG TPA: VWA domain-containing protein [Acidobacteriaceae bacterium]|nr:VWA domain-containing protein [Acidobacteriaceae bacterium]